MSLPVAMKIMKHHETASINEATVLRKPAVPDVIDLSKDEAGFRVAKEFPVECWRCGLNISSASSKSCSLQESTSDTLQLQQLQMMNCGKDVLAAKSDTWASSDQVKVWRQKSSLAGELCRESTVLLDHEEFKSAALVAMYAWSEVIMDGSQCCELLRPPYCGPALLQFFGRSAARGGFSGGSFLALISSLIAALTELLRSWMKDVCRVTTAVFGVQVDGHMAEDHSLRGLYGAAHFAESAASLFAQLYKRFGFQADNVRNQFDHLLSLWRSHCAMLADLDLEVEDEEELEEAAELLEGFRAWRHRLSEELQEPLSRSSVTLCQVRWAQVPLGDWLDSESSPKHLAASLAMKHLAEVARDPRQGRCGRAFQGVPDEIRFSSGVRVTYLLVWGEAGNLRFMPEVIYFLTELTLGADGEPYQAGAEEWSREVEDRSKDRPAVAFCPARVPSVDGVAGLVEEGRPGVDGVIFDEWYQILDESFLFLFDEWISPDRASGVGPEEREKLPTFHTGYEAFLPPDAANYDDWNEFFANVGLLRRGMARLFESEHPKRFAVFQAKGGIEEDANDPLQEVQGMQLTWQHFGIWLLHTLLFFTGLCVVAEEPKDDAETLAGHGIAVRFSGLGLLAPLHALMLMVARIYTSGPALRSSIRGIGCMCAHLSRGLLWLSPLVTYLAVRFSQVRPRRLCRLQVVRYFFWFVVLAAKFLIAVVLFRAVFELILDLQLEPLGRATSRDVLIAWYSTVWTRDLLIWIWLWFSSFFIFCADTQLWFTVGCSLLGVAAFLSQRGCRVCHFALEDAVHELPWRFQEKVLRYAPSAKQAFAKTWNLVIHHMTKEQKINVRDSGELSYDYVMSEEPEPPVLFNRENCLERASKHYCYMSDTREWPVNKELQWRFLALSRGLGLPMPRPYRVPYVPTLTAVIPHFEEPILLQPEDLYSEAPGEARDLGHLIDYLRIKYATWFNYPEVQLQLPDYSTTLKFSSNDLEYHIPFALYSSIGVARPDVRRRRSVGSSAISESEQGRTAFQTAVKLGHDDVVQILASARADPNGHSCDGTPLASAAFREYESMVDVLLHLRAAVNAPFHHCLPAYRQLWQLQIRAIFGWSASFRAGASCQPSASSLTQRRGCRTNLLSCACRCRSCDALLEGSIQDCGATSLLLAKRGHTETVKLIEHGDLHLGLHAIADLVADGGRNLQADAKRIEEEPPQVEDADSKVFESFCRVKFYYSTTMHCFCFTSFREPAVVCCGIQRTPATCSDASCPCSCRLGGRSVEWGGEALAERGLLMPGGQRAWQPRRPPMVATEDAAPTSEDPLGDGQWTTPSASVQPRSQPEEWEWGDENWEVVYLTEGDFGTGGLHPPYGRLGPEMLLTDEPNTIEETFVLENLQGGLDGGVDCDLRQSCIAETTKETCGRTVEQCLMTEVRQSAALPAGPADSFLAIVDTACTKSVAGHDWFERYADWAAAHGYEVCTEDREEHFRFGASKLFVSTFLVKAWFAICGVFFKLDIAIVPCSVPLLFSRPVLASLGMQYNLAAEQVDLEVLGLRNVQLQTCASGHPSLLVSDCEGRKIPCHAPQRRVGELHLVAEEAYMSVDVPVRDAGITYSKSELGRDPEALALIPKKGAAEMTESDIVDDNEDSSEQIQALEKQIVTETYEAGGIQHRGSDEEPVGQSIYETGGDQYQGFELEEDSGLIAEGAADHTYEPGGDQESASEEDSLPPGRLSRIDDFEVIEDDNVTSSGNETMSPRARARHGIRRRRAEQRTNMRKVRDGVMNVFQILMATSVMLAGWAESVVDEHPDIERLTNFPAARYADLDMCQYSLTSSMDGRPLKKAMSLLTNNEIFANAMGRKCHDAGHDHRPIQGKDTSFSSAYPTAFANAVVRAYDKAMREGRSVFENFPTETPSVDQAEDTHIGRTDSVNDEDDDAFYELDSADEIDAGAPARYFTLNSEGDTTAASLTGAARRYRIELPGYPILSDGKADNQNHALPFSRGTITQCVDANQGAYFEQMLLLPNALGEFRWKAKRIVGFPEHITSDLGSVGDFAAGSETAFCTLLQRSYAVLGARMHYGHPDLMNKQYMMQQGGISKGTRTLNLSEDIFAGLDFVLRADGREICHKEYFHLSKGRDLGFNSVLKFFSKLSSGSGEQLLTRQMCRLGQLMSLPEVLTLYYAHAGYYLTQFLLSWVMPTVLFTWSLVLASDCDAHFAAFEPSCGRRPAPELMGRMLASIYTYALLVLVLLATALPLFMEEWLERSFKIAAQRLLKQVFTLSFLMFVFQAKIIGFYVVNELRYGGAKYISTGRSLPTERRPFIRPVPNKVDEYEGLYLDYAIQAFYDGLTLLIASIMVSGLGGMEPVNPYRGGLSALWACIGLTIISWLYAPFVFNPHQFARRHILEDRRVLCHFFWKNWGAGWIRWYEEYQLKPRTGLSISMLDFNFLVFFLGVSVWFAVVNHKVSMMQVIFSSQAYMKEVAAVTLLPPIFTSWISCFLVSQITRVVSSIRRRCCHAQGESTWDVLRPLVPFFAFLVVALEVFEALAALEILRRMQRWKDFLAGPQSRRDGAAPLFFCFCSLRPARLESFGGRCIAMGSNAGTKPMNTAISLVGHEVVVMRPQYEKCSRSVAMC
ncbi:1 [Durusdinium trenchii]|uniref:1 n=1 Tax=Durusdinium trenchii TaxID=1381693 RepID=A0ABP0SR65_9DINO